MTERLYLPDNDDVAEFEATVKETAEDYIVLNRTHFYLGGGGQPADHGRIRTTDHLSKGADVERIEFELER